MRPGLVAAVNRREGCRAVTPDPDLERASAGTLDACRLDVTGARHLDVLVTLRGRIRWRVVLDSHE